MGVQPGAADRLLLVLAGGVDVTQGNQLVEGVLCLPGVFLVTGRVHAALPRHLLPTRDARRRHGLGERLQQGAPLHVVANRQAEQGEHRGRDVQQAGPVDQLVPLDMRAGHAQDPERAVPLRPDLRLEPAGCLGSQMVGMETVVGDEQDRRLGPGELQQPLQHHVVEAVHARDHVLV